MNKFTLLTSVKKKDGGVGAIFLSRLKTHINCEVVRYIPITQYIPGIYGRAISKLFLRSRLIGIVLLLGHLFIIAIQLRKLTRKNLIVTTSSRFLIRMIGILSFFSDISKTTCLLVWDMPDYILRFNTRSYNWLDKIDMFLCKKAISEAKGLITMGHRMDQELSSLCNFKRLRTFHVRSGLSPAVIRTKDVRQESIICLRLVFAGSVYSKDCWNGLVSAVEYLNLTEQFNVVLVHVGVFPATGVQDSEYVERMGPLSLEQTRDIIRSCNVGYVPYSFQERFAVAARTSFAGKINDYISCGVPIFYHGPSCSEVGDSINRSGAGVSCNSLELEDISKALKLVYDRLSVMREELQGYFDSELVVNAADLNRFLTNDVKN